MAPVELTIPGSPVPQPRHRVPRRGKPYIDRGHAIHAYREAVQVFARAAGMKPTSEPVVVDIQCVFVRPTSHLLKGGGLSKSAKAFPPKCDWDNLGKGVCDALTGIAWEDDEQIVDGRCRKRYARPGESEGTKIRISLADEEI